MAPHLSPPSTMRRRRIWSATLSPLFVSLAALCWQPASWAAPEPHTGRARTLRAAPPAPPPPAVPVYACQDPTGRTTYSQFTCTDSATQAARQVSWRDARDASQVRHGQQMQQRERKLLEAIERDRQREAKSQAKMRRAKSHQTDRADMSDAQKDRKNKQSQPEARTARYRPLPPLAATTPTPSRLKP